MHDANGKVLAVGDVVFIPCKVESVSSTPDFCNVGLRTLLGRSPDHAKEYFGSVNTKQVVRANAAIDEVSVVVHESGETHYELCSNLPPGLITADAAAIAPSGDAAGEKA